MTTALSPWPVKRARLPLLDFLKYPTEPLSEKATAGFLSRTKKGTLRFPDGFIAAIETHLQNVRRQASA